MTIAEYLKGIRDIQPTSEGKAFYNWVLANGKAYTRRAMVNDYGEVKKCFYNAQMAAISADSDAPLAYCEGWGVIDSVWLPMEHGFNITAAGEVYDATWRNGKDYFGVLIPTNYVAERLLKTGISDNMLYAYYCDKVKQC